MANHVAQGAPSVRPSQVPHHTNLQRIPGTRPHARGDSASTAARARPKGQIQYGPKGQPARQGATANRARSAYVARKDKLDIQNSTTGRLQRSGDKVDIKRLMPGRDTIEIRNAARARGARMQQRPRASREAAKGASGFRKALATIVSTVTSRISRSRSRVMITQPRQEVADARQIQHLAASTMGRQDRRYRASFALGLVSMIVPFLGIFPGMIAVGLALGGDSHSTEEMALGGAGLARAGLICGILGILFSLTTAAVFIFTRI